jgi:hypothetical protein
MQEMKDKLLIQAREQLEEAEAKMVTNIAHEMEHFKLHFEDMRSRL